MRKKVDRAIILALAFVSILISLAHIFGLLDRLPLIGNRAPDLTLIILGLLAGFLAFDLPEHFHDLEERITLEFGPIFRLLRGTDKFRIALVQPLSMYERIGHPLLKNLADRELANAVERIRFDERVSNKLTHEEFGVDVSPYVKSRVKSIRALTRSTVTDWRKFQATSLQYREAQRGKNVRRILVLTDLAQYNEFAREILVSHAKDFGASNIFICSKKVADEVIASLPPSGRIADDEDFAIFDDDVVAFCAGGEVRIRTDYVDRCDQAHSNVIKDLLLSQRKRSQSCGTVQEGG
ncbi:MAG TPA: hypothetical protein VLV89_02940 [Candidatus Acidoferrum sp.]|nr:hypothetical protein [Candidatus Acidoferrum sp.]